MDDELHSPGLSGYAGYALGRMSAQNERALGDFGRALQRRLQPSASAAEVGVLIAENEALRQQLAAVQANLCSLEADYSKLKAWGIKASQVLDKYGLLKA